MSEVSAEDPFSPFLRHDGTEVDTSNPPQRLRWGEYDVKENGKDCRHRDGLSRFRTNFHCCHEIPVESEGTGFANQMLPRPFQENVTDKLSKDYIPQRREPRITKYEVFPQNDPSRTDDAGSKQYSTDRLSESSDISSGFTNGNPPLAIITQNALYIYRGDYFLGDTTRDSIQSFHNKLYTSSPRYGGPSTSIIHSQSDILERRVKRSFAETQSSDVPFKRVRFADDIGQPIEQRPLPRSEIDFLSNPSNWPTFEYEEEPNFESYLHRINEAPDDTSEEEVDENQNFHSLLLSDVYGYRLPSTFHYDQFYTGYLKLMPIYRTNDSASIPYLTNQEQTSGAFPSLAEQEAIKSDLYEKNLCLEEFQYQKEFPRPISPGVDDWVNSSEQLKLKLSQKAFTQKIYHMTHPEDVPDYRDNTTYSKRVFFYGYNSSVYR